MRTAGIEAKATITPVKGILGSMHPEYPDGSAMLAVAVVAMVAALPAMISPSTELAVKSRCRPMLLEASNVPGALTSH